MNTRELGPKIHLIKVVYAHIQVVEDVTSLIGEFSPHNVSRVTY